MKAYKIVERDGDALKTLFHGLNGSRVIPLNKWLRCSEGTVRDGIGRWYKAGWHCFPSQEIARKYLRAFRKPRPLAIVECDVRVIRPKPSSRFGGVYLARWIRFSGGPVLRREPTQRPSA